MTGLPDWLKQPDVANDLAEIKVKPDEAIKHLDLARDHGASRIEVEADPEPFERASERSKASAALAGKTALPAWLSDPDNAAIAKDDLDTLGWFESLPNAMERGAVRAAMGLYSIPARAEAANAINFDQLFDRVETLDPGLEFYEVAENLGLDPMSFAASRANMYYGGSPNVRSALREKNVRVASGARDALGYIGDTLDRVSQIPMSGAASRFRDTFFEGEDPTLSEIIGKIAQDPPGFTAFITETAAESVPVLAAGAATTAVTRSPQAGIAVMSGGSFSTEFVTEVDQFLRENGADTTTAEGWLEIFENQALLDEANARGLTRGLIIGGLDAVSGGVAGRTLASSEMGDLALQALAQAFLGAGGEAAAQYANDGDIDLREVVIEGLAELVTAPIEVLGVAGRSLGSDAARAGKSGDTAITLQSIDEMAAQSALRGRAPEKFREFLNQTQMGDMTLSVPAEDLRTLFQAKDIGPEYFEIDGDAFEESLVSGGDVLLPATVYADKISGTDMAGWFHDNAVLRDDEMSASEAARFNAEWQDTMMAAWEERQAEIEDDLASRAGDIQVRDQVFAQLRAAGQSPDVADRNSALYAAFFRTMGERYGEDTLDLARQFGLRIEGPDSPAARQRNNLDIALNTLRARKGKTPKPESLMQFVIGLGGLQDRGGDVAALEGPSTLISETADEMAQLSAFPRERRGVGLDEAARRAVEEGFFPEQRGALESSDDVEADLVPLLLDALQREMAGDPTFRVNEQPDESLDVLRDEIDRLGLSLDLTNDELVAALTQDGGETFFQTPSESIKRYRNLYDDGSPDPSSWNDLSEAPESADLIAAIERASGIDGLAGASDAWVKQEGIKSGVEHVVVFDKSGDPMAIGRGEKSRISFPGYLIRALHAGEAAYLTHNHPANRGFSGDDYGVMGVARSEIAAIGHKGARMRARMTPQSEEVFQISDVTSARKFNEFIARIERTALAHIQYLHNKGEIGHYEANEGFHHVVSMLLHRHSIIDLSGNVPQVVSDLGIDASTLLSQLDKKVKEHVRRAGYSVTETRDPGGDFALGSLEQPNADRRGVLGVFAPSGQKRKRRRRDPPADPRQLTLFEASRRSVAPQTETAAFKEWFGDSKVVDDEGKPLVVYHGTPADIDRKNFRFNQSLIGSTTDAGHVGRGFYFASTKGEAGYYGPNVASVYLSMQNPLVLTNDTGDLTFSGHFKSWAPKLDAIGALSEDQRIALKAIADADAYVDENVRYVRGVAHDGQEGWIAKVPNPAPGFTDEIAMRPKIRGGWPETKKEAIEKLRHEFRHEMQTHHRDVFPGLGSEHASLTDYVRMDLGPDALTNAAKAAGHDGIIWGDEYVAFSPEQIKSVQNRGTFDKTDPRILYQSDKSATSSKAFGSITFPLQGIESGETVIKLTEDADLSTFLHESGHFFLEAFRALAEREDATDEMRADLAAIDEYLGHKGGAYSTEAHETWARSFEAYLMEGKAPSLELADAFARFKAWLVRIYRSMAGLNVKLSPEVRDVMDRMIATDKEIAEARAQQDMRPLFADAKVAGMTDAEFKPYQRLARRSAEDAERRLFDKTMAKVRREREKWYREEKKAVRKQVEESTNRRREYRLIEMLANRKWLGEDAGEIPDIQIDRAALVDRFGQGVLAELSRARLGGKRAIYGANGESPDIVADYFGFGNADEMIRVLQNTIKRKDFIDQEVERIMVERHGDPLNDGSIEEEALAAIHSEQQAQTVAAEARHLAKRAGRDTRNITSRVFRQRARAMLGKMEVRFAARPAQFLKAERQSARSAQKAFSDIVAGRGNAEEKLVAAQRYKEQQLLNHYLYMEARDLEQEVKRGRERMRKYDKASVRAKLDGDYIEQIDGILADYEFRLISQREVDRRNSLQDYVDRMVAAGRENELSIDQRLIDNARRVHYSRLSVDELRGLFDTIANIDHMGRHKQKLIDAKRQREFDEVVNAVTDGIRKNISGSPPGRVDDGSSRGKRWRRQYLNLIKNADTFLREIDGYKDLGPAWRNIKEPIDEGMARLTERRDQMARDLDGLYEVYTGSERVDMHKVRAIEGVETSLSKWSVISMALNTGNPDNYDRLMSGDGGFSAAEIEAALATLDERDWRFVQSMWDYINSFWPEIEAKEKRLTGVAPKKVDARPMVPAFDFVRGGYYPIQYDARFSGSVTDNEAKEMSDLVRGGRFGKAQTRKGHTKERTASGGQTLKLGMEVAHSHLDKVIYDIELNEAVVNAWRILQDDRVKDAFKAKGKGDDRQALEWWVQDTAAGDRIRAEGMEIALRHIRSGFTTSRLAMNFSTAAIQWTGLSQSAVVLGKRNMLNGMLSYLRRPMAWAEDIAGVSSVMRKRQQTFERDVMNVVGDIEIGPTSDARKFWRNYFLPSMFLMMQKVQYYTVDLPTWIAAYEAKLGENGNEADARTYADMMVKRAQGSGTMSDRGALERGTMKETVRQSEWARAFTALGSYMFAKFNVAYEQTGKTDFKDPKQVISLVSDYLMLFVLEAAALVLIRQIVPAALSDGEIPEEEDLVKALGAETLNTLAGMFPVVRELSGAVAGFGGGGIFGSSIETIARPIYQAAQGEFDKGAVKALVGASGIGLIGLPSSQINTFIDAAFDQDLGVRDDASLIEFLIKDRS